MIGQGIKTEPRLVYCSNGKKSEEYLLIFVKMDYSGADPSVLVRSDSHTLLNTPFFFAPFFTLLFLISFSISFTSIFLSSHCFFLIIFCLFCISSHCFFLISLYIFSVSVVFLHIAFSLSVSIPFLFLLFFFILLNHY